MENIKASQKDQILVKSTFSRNKMQLSPKLSCLLICKG